jgi:hypothetical protein
MEQGMEQYYTSIVSETGNLRFNGSGTTLQPLLPPLPEHLQSTMPGSGTGNRWECPFHRTFL